MLTTPLVQIAIGIADVNCHALSMLGTQGGAWYVPVNSLGAPAGGDLPVLSELSEQGVGTIDSSLGLEPDVIGELGGEVHADVTIVYPPMLEVIIERDHFAAAGPPYLMLRAFLNTSGAMRKLRQISSVSGFAIISTK